MEDALEIQQLADNVGVLHQGCLLEHPFQITDYTVTDSYFIRLYESLEDYFSSLIGGGGIGL